MSARHFAGRVTYRVVSVRRVARVVFGATDKGDSGTGAVVCASSPVFARVGRERRGARSLALRSPSSPGVHSAAWMQRIDLAIP